MTRDEAKAIANRISDLMDAKIKISRGERAYWSSDQPEIDALSDALLDGFGCEVEQTIEPEPDPEPARIDVISSSIKSGARRTRRRFKVAPPDAG